MDIEALDGIPGKNLKSIKAEVSKIITSIQDRRKELGFTQESFAEYLDVSVTTVKFIEQGRRLPSLPMLIRVATALKLSVRLVPRT